MFGKALRFFLIFMLAWGCCAGVQAEKLEVVTTLFPLYDFAREIGQDKVHVTLLLPPGVEAHSYHPTPRDVMRIDQADVFIYAGKAMEPWVEDIRQGLDAKGLLVLDASRMLTETTAAKASLPPEGEDHHGYGPDPHFWLDPVLVQDCVDGIASGLAAKDPRQARFFLQQAIRYKRELQELDAYIRRSLAHCRRRTVLYGGHQVFGYFGRRYNLEFVTPYHNFSPNAQPNPRHIIALAKKLKQYRQPVIYHEELMDPKVARVLAEETGARLMLLHGAHNISKDEQAQGVTYLAIMKANVEKLKQGLECRP
ncbi:zinc ABC transporter substrate-binding protein [candidate division FCPU426 bacterium]|nr:zinc ABC transporter substrate-binding protein [candidate division FCPU426 bacterium]